MRERLAYRFNILNKYLENIPISNDFKKFQNSKILVLIVAFLLIFNICACQKKSNITIYAGPSENNIGESYVTEGKYNEELDYYKVLLKQVIEKEGENSSAAAQIYNYIAEIYIYQQNQNEELKYIDKAVKINTDYNDQLSLAGNYLVKGKIYSNIGGDVEEGLSYLEDAEAIYSNFFYGYTLEMADVLINKGKLYTNMNKYEEALKNYENALDIYQKNDQKDAVIYLLIGQIYAHENNFEKAEDFYNKAEIIIIENKEIFLKGNLNKLRGSMYVTKGDYKNAINEYEEALKVFCSDEQYKLNVAQVCNNLGYAYAMNRNLEMAVEKLIISCKIIENTSEDNELIEKDKRDYKQNLKTYYQALTKDKAEENFEKWYQDKMSEGIEGVDNSQ